MGWEWVGIGDRVGGWVGVRVVLAGGVWFEVGLGLSFGVGFAPATKAEHLQGVVQVEGDVPRHAPMLGVLLLVREEIVELLAVDLEGQGAVAVGG